MSQVSFPHSTAIASATYDEQHETLAITFRTGTTYTYRDVPTSIWEELQMADSAGRFWHSSIKDQFS